MDVLVIGGTGFIGSNVVRSLAEQGRGVVAYDLSPARTFEGTVLADLKGKFRVESGSVTDLPRILHIIKKHNIEGIIHCAAMLPTLSPDQPMETLQVNVIGTANILEAARIANLRRVVIASTSLIVAASDDPITPTREEAIELPPPSIYALSKLTMEYLAYVYRTCYSVDAIAVRPRCVYGPSSREARYTHATPTWEVVPDAVAGKPIIRETGGDEMFDFTYVKDCAKGLIQAYDCKSPTYHVYHLSRGRNRKMSEVCDVLRGLFPDLTIEVGPGPWKRALVRGEQQEDLSLRFTQLPPLDITRAQKDFGYDPEWDIERAIPDWVRWLKEGKY